MEKNTKKVGLALFFIILFSSLITPKIAYVVIDSDVVGNQSYNSTYEIWSSYNQTIASDISFGGSWDTNWTELNKSIGQWLYNQTAASASSGIGLFETNSTVIYNQTTHGLGIGTDQVVNMLDVEGGVAIRSSIFDGTVAPTDGLFVEGSIFVGGVGGLGELDLYEATSNAQSTIRLSTADGGSGATDGFLLEYVNAVSNWTKFWGYEDSPMIFATNNVERLRIDRDGAVNISGKLFVGSGWTAVNDTFFYNQTISSNIDFQSSFYANYSEINSSTGRWDYNMSHWNSDGTNVWRDSGRVGIGAQNPQGILHVNGSLVVGSENKSIELDAGDILADFYYLDADIFTSASGGNMQFQDEAIGPVTLSTLAAGGGAGCGVANSILSGGLVTYTGSGLTFRVSQTTYCIGGLQYNFSSPVTITLAAANDTYDRFDSIIVNTSNTATAITGEPSENPVIPSIDSTREIRLTAIRVSMGQTNFTEPPINDTNQTQILFQQIYNEDTEWTSSQNTPVGQVSFTESSDPQDGTNHIETTTSLGNNDYFELTNSTFGDPYGYETLTLYVKVVSGFSNRNKLEVQWTDGSSLLGNALTLPVDEGNTATYQVFDISLSSFGSLGTDVQALRFTAKNFKTQTIDFKMDNIYITGVIEGNGTDPGGGGAIYHSELVDMPSSANQDHDGRYPCKWCGAISLSGDWTFTNNETTPITIAPTSPIGALMLLFDVQDDSGNKLFTVDSAGLTSVNKINVTTEMQLNEDANITKSGVTTTMSIDANGNVVIDWYT